MAGEGRRSTPADERVGRQVRQRRREIKLTQQQLAAKLGLSFQQVQKYESGATRIGASRLEAIARALDISPHHFFEDTSAPGAAEVSRARDAFLRLPEAGEIMAAMTGIDSPDIRKQAVELLKSLAVLSRASRRAKIPDPPGGQGSGYDGAGG